jgi:uroporphyrinogen-III synthase
VERYVEIMGSDRVPPVVACNGPITAETARAGGLTVDVVASEHTIPGLVDALVRYVS